MDRFSYSKENRHWNSAMFEPTTLGIILNVDWVVQSNIVRTFQPIFLIYLEGNSVYHKFIVHWTNPKIFNLGMMIPSAVKYNVESVATR